MRVSNRVEGYNDAFDCIAVRSCIGNETYDVACVI